MKIKAENCGCFSLGGVTYTADENGIFDLPIDFPVAELISHGFLHHIEEEKLTPTEIICYPKIVKKEKKAKV